MGRPPGATVLPADRTGGGLQPQHRPCRLGTPSGTAQGGHGPTEADEILEAVAQYDRMLRRLEPGISRGDVASIGEARRIMHDRAELLDLFPATRQELSGSDGGPITFAMVPNEDKAEVIRAFLLEGERRLKAVEATGKVAEPKALGAAEKRGPKKRTAKRAGHVLQALEAQEAANRRVCRPA